MEHHEPRIPQDANDNPIFRSHFAALLLILVQFADMLLCIKKRVEAESPHDVGPDRGPRRKGELGGHPSEEQHLGQKPHKHEVGEKQDAVKDHK